jgi:hypothetical protein
MGAARLARSANDPLSAKLKASLNVQKGVIEQSFKNISWAGRYEGRDAT